MPDTGPAHGLGPHVVGQRVVVRRLLPGETGPSGGPAMTDVLGLLVRWDATSCVVAPESGAPVEIPLDLVVTGKPVPQRASVRARVSARDAERHALVLWPQVERRPLGEWELRSDPAPVGRLLKRANSTLAFGDPGLALDEAAALVSSFYVERSRTAMAQVEIGSPPDAGLSDLGWTPVPGGDAHFLVTSVAMALRLVGEDAAVELEEDGPRVRVTRWSAGQGIATARAGVDGDWLGVHGLGVEPHHRGYGHGTAMMAALLEWGAERGATTVWLHVETDNAPALALYDKLGFRVHHTNRYLAAPPEAAPSRL